MRKLTSLSLTADERAQLEYLAEVRGVTMTQVIRNALDEQFRKTLKRQRIAKGDDICQHFDLPEIQQCEYCAAYSDCVWH